MNTPTRRLFFGVALTLSTTVGFFTLFALSVLAPFITADLQLSGTAFGVLGTILFVVSAIAAGVLGRLLDRYDAKAMLLALLAVASASWLAIAGARSYVWLAAAVGLAGVSLGLILPTTRQLVYRHVTPGRRGLLVGVSQSGSQLGAMLAGAALPAIAVFASWRIAIMAGAVFALSGAAIAVLAVPDSAPTPAAHDPFDDGSSSRSVRWLSAFGCLMNAGVTVLAVYVPLFAFEALGFSPALAGLTTVVVAAIAICAKPLWGLLQERSVRGAFPLAALGALGFASAAGLAIAEEVGAWGLWAGVVAYGAGSASWAVVAMTALSRTVPAGLGGQASGRVMLMSFVGAAVGPGAFGAVADTTGTYALGWWLTAAVFGAATAVALGWGAFTDRPSTPARNAPSR